MKYLFLAFVLAFMTLTGCSGKYTNLRVDFTGTTEAGKEQSADGKVINVFVFWAPGFDVRTKTDQKSDAQIPISMYGANSATGDQVNPQATFSATQMIEAAKSVIEVLDSEETPVVKLDYKISHIQVDGPDGGTSLVQLLGDERFDSCKANGKDLRYHGLDKERHSFWDRTITGTKVITCERNGITYSWNTPQGIKNKG